MGGGFDGLIRVRCFDGWVFGAHDKGIATMPNQRSFGERFEIMGLLAGLKSGVRAIYRRFRPGIYSGRPSWGRAVSNQPNGSWD